jgi:isopentenyldiphosphate isomerase
MSSYMKKSHEYPNTTVSDENDENVRYVRWEDAVAHGWIRRVAEVFLIDRDTKKVLLQKRSANVGVSPNTWTASVGEGVDEGEGYEEAAVRGVAEELGIEGKRVEFLGKVFSEYKKFHDDEALTRTWSSIYTAEYAGEEIMFPEDEISEVKWFTIGEVEELLDADPAYFATRFPSVWEGVGVKLKGLLR